MSISVSIIIPTYNRNNTIGEALESVLNQSYQHIEIIVIDDGSTDDTEKFIKHHFKRVKYFYQNNAGPGAARNNGIKEARGEYIAFLDSDDLWSKDKLELQVKFLQSNPDVALCCTDFKEISPNKVIHESVHDHMPVKNGYVFEHLLKHQFIKTSTVMVRADTLKETGLFHETLRAFEDRYLWFNIARIGKIHFLDKCLVTARIQGDNLTSNRSLMYENFISLYAHLLKQEDLRWNQKRLIKKAISTKQNDHAYACRLEGDFTHARSLYLKSFLCFPSFVSAISFLKTFILHKSD